MRPSEQPTSIGISQTALEQLEELRKNPPRYRTYLADQIEAQIQTHIAVWTPRSERGGDGTIKWCDAISHHCNTDIYRLKSTEEMGQWRVFFFLLDLDRPPTRHVAEIVERKDNHQCYGDMTQPHVKRLLHQTAQFKNAERLRLMRAYN